MHHCSEPSFVWWRFTEEAGGVCRRPPSSEGGASRSPARWLLAKWFLKMSSVNKYLMLLLPVLRRAVVLVPLLCLVLFSSMAPWDGSAHPCSALRCLHSPLYRAACCLVTGTKKRSFSCFLWVRKVLQEKRWLG